MPTRRDLVTGTAMLLGAATLPPALRAARPRPGFVTVSGTGLRLDGRPYRYVGTNMWYGAYLAAEAGEEGRARLGRELDRLAALGVRNVRVLGASEKSPLIGAISPTFRDRGTAYNQALLRGLDVLLAEMARRDMRAVLYLNNFWEWSGGMMTYLSWVNGGNYIDAHDPRHPWPAFADRTAQFYAAPAAVASYHGYVRALVGRTSSVTGRRYADDPTIMAWQLANEPRPGESPAAVRRIMPHYQRWIRSTARLIKSIDPHHLVSTGGEGMIGCAGSEACVVDSVSPGDIDYMTIHIWPQNFGWVDPADLDGTRAAGERRTSDYISAHVAVARRVGKPLVIEEFGYPRDGGSYEPGSPTTHRDRYYRLVMEAVASDAAGGGPLAGLNFWAWNGEGRARHADHRFRPGDTAYLGDPSHEPQGWYGVFDRDASTLALIGTYATRLSTMA